MAGDEQSPRNRLEAELASAYEEFHAMVAAVSEQNWTGPSLNPGWTNGQVVFHVLLGFMLVLPLSRLLVVFGHLPPACGRAFARALDFSTPLFNRVNAFGPRIGARALGRAGVVRRFDRVHAVILRRLARVSPGEWKLTMAYPTRWDPRFRSSMHLEDLFVYPVGHLRHHRAQLRGA